MGGYKKYLRASLVVLALVFTFLLVYGPHFSYKYPFHIDEWRHITEAKRLGEGELPQGQFLLEIGFDTFLLMLSKVGFDLVLSYKYLPAIFACISSLILFFFVYKKTNRFYIALLSMLFFASLRSNVNLTGLWFFTPLTFAIPFIFLFFWLFSEGVEKNNLKLVYWSFFVYFIILVTHPISATFMIPILVVYLYIHKKFVIDHYKLLLIFLAILFLALVLFSKFFWRGSLLKTLSFVFSFIFFKQGWGVLEVKYNIMTLYGLLAFALAIIGVYFAYKKKKYLFVVWSLTLLFFILFFRLFGFTILAPYQRILYYTMLGLIPLSAMGLFYILMLVKSLLKIKLKLVVNMILLILALFVFLNIFSDYYRLDEQVALYRVIDDNGYNAIKFLQQFPKTTILAPVHTSTAIHPISGHDVVATFYFYGNRKNVEEAYASGNCTKIFELAKQEYATFIMSPSSMLTCKWDEIYNNNYYIYKVQ